MARFNFCSTPALKERGKGRGGNNKNPFALGSSHNGFIDLRAVSSTCSTLLQGGKKQSLLGKQGLWEKVWLFQRAFLCLCGWSSTELRLCIQQGAEVRVEPGKVINAAHGLEWPRKSIPKEKKKRWDSKVSVWQCASIPFRFQGCHCRSETGRRNHPSCLFLLFGLAKSQNQIGRC